MNSTEKTNDLRNEILSNNKILYCMYNHPMIETCMCWGLEVPDAWLDEIDDLSKKLEAINLMIYPKYHVRIQADQVKDKYAFLHYYYDVVIDPPKCVCAYENVIEKLVTLINKLDFKMIEVLDKDEHDEIVENTIDDMSLEDAIEANKNVSNVKVFERDGKVIKQVTYHYYKQTHYKPTKHKLLYKLIKNKYVMQNFIRKLISWKPSYEQNCIAKVLHSYASKCVNESIHECECLCENCGHHIGESYSPRCTTYGWISYLCEDCASKDDRPYQKNGEVWKKDKMIKDKDGNLVSSNSSTSDDTDDETAKG